MRFFGTLVVLFSFVFKVLSYCQVADIYFRLRNPASGFVLDSRMQTTLAAYLPGNYSFQFWKMQPSSRIGLFNIVNGANGKVIDVETVPRSDQVYYATVNDLEDSLYQQWFINSEGTIINGGYHNHALRIRTGEVYEGIPIILWDRYDDDDLFQNELFVIDFLNKNDSAIIAKN